MPKILIADDHAIVCKGLVQLISDEFPDAEVAAVGTGNAVLDQLRASHWDVLILDINMPDRGGVDILKHVRASHPETSVLIFSGFPEKQYAVNLMRAGASGYLNKDLDPEELMNAVRAALAGRRYVSPTMANLLVEELDKDSERPAHLSLSEREFQIFCKLAKGQAVSNIAGELHLSAKTVSTYRARVLEKMGFASNADMTAYALRNELIS